MRYKKNVSLLLYIYKRNIYLANKIVIKIKLSSISVLALFKLFLNSCTPLMYAPGKIGGTKFDAQARKPKFIGHPSSSAINLKFSCQRLI